jgi:hypothetical protein
VEGMFKEREYPCSSERFKSAITVVLHRIVSVAVEIVLIKAIIRKCSMVYLPF